MKKETKKDVPQRNDSFAEYDSIDRELSKTYFRKSGNGGGIAGGCNQFTYNKKTLRIVLAAVIFFVFIVALIIYRQASKPVARKNTEVKIYESGKIPANSRVFYDFEKDTEGWKIPSWALDKPDHVAKSLTKTDEAASNGAGSIKLSSDFPGGRWTASLIEIEHYLDLGNYDLLTCDVYLPENAPAGLRAQMILTVGAEWKFTEMSRTFRLIPGQWVRITADISEGSGDFRRTTVNMDFKNDIRKIAIRFESNQKPVYSGPVYIDNIRLWYN